MPTLSRPPVVPVHPFRPDAAVGNPWFTMARSEGGLVYEADLLLPHRKAYYLLVFVRHNRGRHWVDGTPYDRQDNRIYFTNPSQILVKEDPTPSWSTHLTFTNELLALEQNAVLRSLPLIQNLRHGHELVLTSADTTFVEEQLARLETEYRRPGEWQHRMLTAHLTVLLTYLSRLYAEQYPAAEPSADQRVLRAYQAKVEECFRELHEVGAYAELLHLSAGHLSEVVKAQSGKPAIKHLHERLVLEARRLLLYSPSPLKEIAFDLGFAEPSYFGRFFKRETGVTPAEYRSISRKMYQ
ncbi:AraC family transcriptional regulator [Hymenobacter persicinus]|uniref:AraC family transcriptional regulator n=1 Tax=Hymenobacter persicinus TaxID=2025506 RepID=A0A4Q5LBW3_9BACT|nr:helix-turn-helix domain-containing protein [Hymenobacter persicinus]RYU80094.1 AraC family transcriptional regulator [Hymenobacter persicinus]